ncbi:MAG: hypothetical protein JWM80_5748 [Cyanobacteria bacterium RYN_339]|nr:hypothetical protein [Cyanobacteria bacterium RYN_339]
MDFQTELLINGSNVLQSDDLKIVAVNNFGHETNSYLFPVSEHSTQPLGG